MPTYDYYCSTNDRTLEIRHGMDETITSWGELCTRAQIEPGETPSDSPVQRLITGGHFIHSAKEPHCESSAPPPCLTSGQCACL